MLINSSYYSIPNSLHQADIDPRLRLVVYTEDLTPQSQELLTKMLQATRLETNQFTHIITNNTYLPLKKLAESTDRCKVLCFNIDQASIGIQVDCKAYKPLFIGEMEIIFVEDLEVIAQEAKLKKFIWEKFKTWFVHE